jgi:hypothetical protein
VNRPGSVAVTAQLVGSGLRLNEWTGVDKETVMNQQAMRQAARRSARMPKQYGAKSGPTANAGSKSWRSPC